MAPLDERYQNDVTFDALLSSQRELLNKLNFEKQLQQTEVMRNHHLACATAGIANTNSTSWGNATNQSIGFDTFRSDNMLLSRRLSVGIGNDRFILPDSQFDSDNYAESFFEPEALGKKRLAKDESEADNVKRRRTTLSFLDYIFDKKEETKEVTAMKQEKQRFEYDDSDDDDYGVIIEDVSDDEDYDDDDENDYFEPQIDLVEAKKKMISFDGAMGSSQESQQAIHDWDRKMGLKRSHSKTMRLSSRSRKQLRDIMQKDIKGLSD